MMILSSLGIMGIVLERFLRAELGRQAEEGSRLLAASLAHEIGSFIDLHFIGLSLLESQGFSDASGPELLQRTYPAFESVLLADRSGRVVQASTLSLESGFDLSMRDYFRIPFNSQKNFVSPPFISEARYTSSAVLARPSPDHVAIAYISLGFMNEFIAGLPSSESKSIAVVDSSGEFIASNPAAFAIWRSDIVSLETWFLEHDPEAGSGHSIGRSLGGEDEFLCWATVPGVSSWTVIVAEPTERVFRAVFFLRIVMACGLVAVGLVTLLVNLSVIRFVRKDIEMLVRFSREIADGKLDTAISFRGFHDFAHLASNMERMGAAIRERESSLRTNERRLFDLLDFLPIPMVLFTRGMDVELMNRALSATLGWTRPEIGTEADWLLAVYPEEASRQEAMQFWATYTDKLRKGERPEGPLKGSLRCKDGSFRTCIGEAALIADRFIFTFVDITQADEAAMRMRASLTEKEVLLKEIHHRVKNNLQVIISLLSLKASSDPGISHMFAESIDRIQVMAGIHELLYKSSDLSHIDLSEYVETLIGWLLSSYAKERIQPAMDLRLEPIELDIDKAIPCGLIMNEVLTNSLKYAFRQGMENPGIGVAMTRTPDGRIVMELSDNGVGLPPGLVPGRSESLGMQLIVSLCAQLHGSWNLDSSAGTRWTISFDA